MNENRYAEEQLANSNSHLASVNERIQKLKIEEIVMTKVKVEMIASRQR